MGLLLICSGLVSGSETAVFSLQPSERRKLSHGRPLLSRLLQQPARLLVALLVANLLINVGYFTLSASLSLELQNNGRPLAAWGVAFVSLGGIVVVGEILPKTLALVSPARLVLWLCPLLLGLRTILAPLVAVGAALTGVTERLLLGEHRRQEDIDSKDFKSALSSSVALGAYRSVELALLHDVVDVAERRARSLMVPRVDVAFLDIRETPQEWVARMAAQPLRDYPVVSGSRDELLGTVNGARFLRDIHGDRRSLVESALLAPLGIGAESLVLRMNEEQRELAILLDEYGGVAGVVRLASLCQGILGEVERLPEARWVRRERGLLWVRGECPVHVLQDELGLDFAARASDTLGGVLGEVLGRLPRKGDEVLIGSWRLRVASMKGRRVGRVALKAVLASPGAAEALGKGAGP
ncbi:MAG: putative hemolysin [Pseudohongiellaceae bacterium]|jgi:putative hemolysin